MSIKTIPCAAQFLNCHNDDGLLCWLQNSYISNGDNDDQNFYLNFCQDIINIYGHSWYNQ